jgi:DnaJ homolog subfamily B member 4
MQTRTLTHYHTCHTLHACTDDTLSVTNTALQVVNPGYEKVIAKEGMPLSKQPGERGDLIIRFKLVFPQYLPDDKKLKMRHLLAGEIDMGSDSPPM